MTDEIVAWLNVQIDTDERLAHACLYTPAANLTIQLGLPLWEARHLDRSGDYPSVWQDKTMVAGRLGEDVARHMASWDPARVLAEVESKRLILSLWRSPGAPQDAESSDDFALMEAAADTAETAIKALAVAYRHRDGWREEWAA